MAPIQQHTIFQQHKRLLVRMAATLAVVGVMAILIVQVWFTPQELLPHDLAEIEPESTLYVIAEKSAFGFLPDDSTGFAYQVATVLADSLRVKVSMITANGLDRQIKLLEDGKHSYIIASPLPKTAAYSDKIAYTKALFTSHYVLVQHKSDSTLTTVQQLEDNLISIPENSTIAQQLAHLSEDISVTMETKSYPSKSNREMVEMLQKGEIAYTICSEMEARKWRGEFPELDFSLAVGFTQHYTWAYYAPAQQLGEKLDLFLAQFVQTPQFAQILQRYIN